MGRTRISRWTLFVVGVASMALLAAAGVAGLRVIYARREGPFASACLSARAGAPFAATEAAFSRIGERTSGSGWSSRGGTHAFFRRSGLSRFQQCTIEVDAHTQRVTSIDLRAATDFTSCADRGAYPRRFWLCAIADWIAP